MTRQEAIDKLLPICEPEIEGPYTLESHLSAGAFVDSLVALGMFKVEKPKSVEERLREQLNRVIALADCDVAVLASIHAAGLKLVDK